MEHDPFPPCPYGEAAGTADAFEARTTAREAAESVLTP